jgi:hypothetical protein
MHSLDIVSFRGSSYPSIPFTGGDPQRCQLGTISAFTVRHFRTSGVEGGKHQALDWWAVAWWASLLTVHLFW